jgi:hypothetical protein
MCFTLHKALPGFFLCIFSFITCLKKPVFSKLDLLQWKVPAWGTGRKLKKGLYSGPSIKNAHLQISSNRGALDYGEDRVFLCVSHIDMKEQFIPRSLGLMEQPLVSDN